MLKYNKVLLKLSGEALKGHSIYDFSILENIFSQIKELSKRGVKIIIVIGGGNIWRGDMEKKRFIEKDSHYMGMTATLINSLALKSFFDNKNLNSRILSNLPIENLFPKYKKDLANEILTQGDILIVGGGTGKPYVSTDSLAINLAIELECDAILMAKNKTNGIYSKDPNKFKNAKFIKTMSYEDYVNDDIKIIDVNSIRKLIETESEIEILVFEMKAKNKLINLWDNENELKTVLKK